MKGGAEHRSRDSLDAHAKQVAGPRSSSQEVERSGVERKAVGGNTQSESDGRSQVMRLRRMATVGAFLGVALLAAASARATTTNYWGYNYISSSNPPAHTCQTDPSGVACAGWNYWDYSQIQRSSSSGGIVFFGFRFCSGCSHS